MSDIETTASALMHSFATEEFAIEAYAMQVLQLPTHKPILSPQMFPAKVIKLSELNAIYTDLVGITDNEIRHRHNFWRCLKEIGYDNKPIEKIILPESVNKVSTPAEPAPAGFKTIWENLVFDRQQEERAQKTYAYFAATVDEQYKKMFQDTAFEEGCHQKIFDNLLKGILNNKPIKVKCPVCGQTLEIQAEAGKKVGCPSCTKAFELKIIDGDYALARI